MRRATGKPREHRSPRKIDVTGKLTVVSVSVVTLIRTDTTLDLSQKAEKVWVSYTPCGVYQWLFTAQTRVGFGS